MRDYRFPLFPIPSIGAELVIPPNDQMSGGRAIVRDVAVGVSGGALVHFVTFAIGGWCRRINWEQFLSRRQAYLRETFGDRVARPD
jgi:hypothetical protein